MQVSKTEARTLTKAIHFWHENQWISDQQSEQLQTSYQVTPFDWKRLAKYSFWLALCCIVIAVISALSDHWLMALLKKLFDATDLVKCLAFTLLAGALYGGGLFRKRRTPQKIYSNEAIFFLGVVATAIAIAFFGRVIDTGSGHFSLLILLATVIYAILGLYVHSTLIWLFALFSMASWLGAETGYLSGWGAYYLGINYPLRFLIFGIILTLAGEWLFRHWHPRRDFLRPTRATGLLFLFVSLWLLSIFGNYGDLDAWFKIKQYELLQWSLLFAVVALLAIYHGIKYHDGMTRGFGITFIFINLYTRFFEYFWDMTHKTIFFAILALSFWYLGSRAEKIWQLEMLKHKKPSQ